jgi:hypothetical protein
MSQKGKTHYYPRFTKIICCSRRRYGYSPQESRASYASYEDENDGEYYYGEESGDATLGDVIYEKEIDTRSLPQKRGRQTFEYWTVRRPASGL